MDETTKSAPGWFPAPGNPGLLRYWDGARWTDNTAPSAPPAATAGGVSAWTIATGVAVGLVSVIALVLFVSSVTSADDDLECARVNVERVQRGLPALNC